MGSTLNGTQHTEREIQMLVVAITQPLSVDGYLGVSVFFTLGNPVEVVNRGVLVHVCE